MQQSVTELSQQSCEASMQQSVTELSQQSCEASMQQSESTAQVGILFVLELVQPSLVPCFSLQPSQSPPSSMEESSLQSEMTDTVKTEVTDTEKRSAEASCGEEADIHNQEPSPNSSKVDTSSAPTALPVDDNCLNSLHDRIVELES